MSHCGCYESGNRKSLTMRQIDNTCRLKGNDQPSRKKNVNGAGNSSTDNRLRKRTHFSGPAFSQWSFLYSSTATSSADRPTWLCAEKCKVATLGMELLS